MHKWPEEKVGKLCGYVFLVCKQRANDTHKKTFRYMFYIDLWCCFSYILCVCGECTVHSVYTQTIYDFCERRSHNLTFSNWRNRIAFVPLRVRAMQNACDQMRLYNDTTESNSTSIHTNWKHLFCSGLLFCFLFLCAVHGAACMPVLLVGWCLFCILQIPNWS